MAEFGSVQDDRSVSFVLISTDWPPESTREGKMDQGCSLPPPPPSAANAIHAPPKKFPRVGAIESKCL